MSINRKINGMNRDHAKFCLVRGVAAILVLALCIGTIGVAQADAASNLAKPKYKLLKRQKKTATLKVSNSKGVTGYRIYLKTGKKGKWKLYDFALHSSKIKITKLKPNKIYYVKLKAWRTKGSSIRYSGFSKTIKINKYKKKTTATATPTPTSTPIATPMPGDGSITSGSAVTVPDVSPSPTPGDGSVTSGSAVNAPDISPVPAPVSSPSKPVLWSWLYKKYLKIKSFLS